MCPLTFKPLLFLLSCVGCCARRQQRSVYAALGRNVTLKTLLNNLDDVSTLDWDFFGEDEDVRVAFWKKKEWLLNKRYQGRGSVNRTSGDLTLGSLTFRDSGDYKIKIQRKDATAVTRWIQLRVLEAVSGTTITGPTATLTAGNSTANLSCRATAGTVETRTWLKDGKPLTASSRLLFSSDMTSMMISTLQKEDNGEYTCRLANPATADEASYKMVVNFGPEQDTQTFTAPPAPPTKFNGMMTEAKTEQNDTEEDEAPSTITGYYVPLFVFKVVVVVFLAVYLLLLFTWKKNRNFSPNGRNTELSVTCKRWAPAPPCEDPTYQSLNPDTMDQDQTYSTLNNTQHT